jgi:hypothetical protein
MNVGFGMVEVLGHVNFKVMGRTRGSLEEPVRTASPL